MGVRRDRGSGENGSGSCNSDGVANESSGDRPFATTLGASGLASAKGLSYSLEKARFELHSQSLVGSREKGRRLACQVTVLGDVEVMKYDQFWGQGDTIVWRGEGN